ncbi:oxidosqualene:lanosterol cyclase [Metarhizium album ARSEF 1941]|uniref:Terpene cyclase/mutase family member n=1 Tax=Metarhizium album (strain ARSEF 1941) TaxID=1081103 RepID=A0A0B2WNS6_METAS|nr:oxidosqualene:lanosterol cyclase [Metarhizium album ARSEF 1941]KHN95648.1 oxidosqualene:lanosterol cyclase [Metarhizium album ARSEF 1941]
MTRNATLNRAGLRTQDTGKMEHLQAHVKRTDITRWRLRDNDSRHTWHYLDDDDDDDDDRWPQSYADKYYLGLPLADFVADLAPRQHLPDLQRATTSLGAVQNALVFLEKLQLPSGHWGCESGGPMTFCAGVVIAWYVTETVIPDRVAAELQAYLAARANPRDGGWGIHTTGDSNVCGTAMNYIVMRIAGMSPHEPLLVRAREFVRSRGGAVYSSCWGKFWMAVLGVVDWDAVHPMPAELWLLPDWVPLHPRRFFAEMRLPGQAMSYLYSKRWTCRETQLVRSLRDELLTQPYRDVDWKRHRTTVSERDYKQPRSRLADAVNWAYVNLWKPYLLPASVKSRAEAWLSELIDVQASNTHHGGIAVTDQPMSTIVSFFRDGPGSVSLAKHVEKMQEFLWMTRDGMQINSTNGSQSWDTAFMVQGICAAGLHRDQRWRDMCVGALRFLERQQIRHDCPEQEKYYRQQRRGCWAFSNRYQGYAVSDCTAEAVKAVITLQRTARYPVLLEDERIFDAVDSIMLYQNSTGGVSAFEARRGSTYLELLNPSEIFAQLMVESDFVECTSSCVTALALFRQHWPRYRTQDVDDFVRRGVRWIKSDQGADGSWYGFWGICYTYGTMFGLEALAAVGETYGNSPAARAACDFLTSKQRRDGGWSESIQGCEHRRYTEDARGSLVVQTAWALIGLMAGEYPAVEPMKRGVQFLMSRQQDNGEWLEEAIPGSFHQFCSFSYPNYKFSFTIRALGNFAQRYPEEKVAAEPRGGD